MSENCLYRYTASSVLFQLLWNFAVNSLLRGLKSSGNGAIAYANDIAIAASEICPQTLSDNLNSVLSTVMDWCRDFVLSINPSKPDTIFTRRYKITTFTLPRICWIRLTLCPETKLNWRANLSAGALLYGVALNKPHNVRLLDKMRRSAAIHITESDKSLVFNA